MIKARYIYEENHCCAMRENLNLKFSRFNSFLCCMLAICVLLSGCVSSQPTHTEPQEKSYFTYFDTVSYIYSYAGDSAEQFEARSAEISDILEFYHKLFDIYHEYSGINNLCTVNRLAGGDPVPVDPALIDFLLYAKELYRKTDGKMNVMMGAVLSLWHSCRTEAANGPGRLPEADALADANRHTDISLLEIDEVHHTVRIADPAASIDVGAIGKGYAAERAAEYLAAENANGYVLNIGGNIRTVGTKPDGSEWLTGIRDPNNADGDFAATIRIADTACVTSGVYERYYTVDGVRYHHIIDPNTLYPAAYFASITVICPDSGLADALSTALFCMSYEDGLTLVADLPDTQVVWIGADGSIRTTPGLTGQLEIP